LSTLVIEFKIYHKFFHSLGAGRPKLSFICHGYDLHFLYDGSLHASRCHLFNTRLANTCHNHKRAFSDVLLLLVVS